MSRASIHADLKRKHPGEYPESCADMECRERQALLAVADAAAVFIEAHDVLTLEAMEAALAALEATP